MEALIGTPETGEHLSKLLQISYDEQYVHLEETGRISLGA
jgi:hypothetical protein